MKRSTIKTFGVVVGIGVAIGIAFKQLKNDSDPNTDSNPDGLLSTSDLMRLYFQIS